MQYVVVQKETTAPTADQWRRALKPVKHLAEADAARLAREVRGLLIKNVSLEEGLAVQTALQAEGVLTEVVPAGELPALPVAKFVKRLELQPQALLVYDPLGRALPVPWSEVTLLSAGAVRHFGITESATQEWVRSYNPMGGLGFTLQTEVRHDIEDQQQFRLEIFLGRAAMRFEIEAATFLFKFVSDRPELNAGEKLALLVQHLARQAPQATLNCGAQAMRDSTPPVAYASKAALADESIWLLWQRASMAMAAPAPSAG
jgi:hypothetical protein